MVQAKFLMSQHCSCLHNIPNSDSITAILPRVTDWGWGARGKEAFPANIVTRLVSHEDLPVYQRELCLPPLKCICATICKCKILHLRLRRLVAFSGTQHKEDLGWLNTVNVLFLDTLSELLPWSWVFSYKCSKYFIHQVKASKPGFKIVNSWGHFLCSMKVLLRLQREFECSPLNHCFHLFRK